MPETVVAYAHIVPIAIAIAAGIAAVFTIGYLRGWTAMAARLRVDPQMRRRALHIAPLDDLPWIPTHRHRKGGLYQELMRGVREADLAPVVIYKGEDGTVWTRSATEFDDGRFTPLAPDAGPPTLAMAAPQR